MVDWFRAFGVEPAWLVKAVFEANLLLLFVICFAHSLRSHGWQRTLREFGGGFLLTCLCESCGVLSGAYVYPGFEFYVIATPVGNPASWVALVYIIMTITDRLVFGERAFGVVGELAEERAPLRLGKSLLGTIVVLAFCDATLALVLDLVLDPLATIYNWWLWVPSEAGVRDIQPGLVDPYNFAQHVWMTTPDNPVGHWFGGFFPEGFRYPTRVFGIPLINFVAWFVFVFVFTSQFRWVESQRAWSERKKTIVLWTVVLIDVPILCPLLIIPNL
jgi:uncharacterized membrane protein